MMINFFSYFITCSNSSAIADVIGWQLYFTFFIYEENNFISAHINHVREVAGIDYVGIGASYDGINE